jgi:hypothetical protein
MDLHDETGTEGRFRAYAADLASVLGHADRVRPFEDYCVGLLSAEGRKSVEPLAAVTAPERTAAQHQSLLHLVAQAPWSDQAVLGRVRERVLPSITRDQPIQGWIVDDTSFPKKGSHSVGVARQYCGQLGKQDNCQVAVSLSVATHYGSLPVAYRLYLPKEWADDPVRRTVAGVPDDIEFQTKPVIPCSKCAKLWLPACRRVSCWLIQRMATTAVFELGSPNLACLTRSVSCPPRQFGDPARHHCRRRGLRAAAGPPRGCAAMRRINRSRSRRWLWSLPPMPGSRSPGGTAATRH